MALNVATAAFQSRRGLEHMPERFGASLTVRWEMIEGGNELVAFVGQAVGLIPLRNALHVSFLPTLTFIGIKDLRNKNILFILCYS